MANLCAGTATMNEVCVTYVDSPCKFFVVPSENVAYLDAIRLQIEKEFARTDASNETCVAFGSLTTLSPCIARWEGRWYRARVVFRRLDGKIEVEYIDYGNTAVVEAAEVKNRPANQLISSTERLAWPCRLAGDTSCMDKTRFEEICAETEGRFKMKIDDVDDETAQQIVTLYTEQCGRSVNELIRQTASGKFGEFTAVATNSRAPAEVASTGQPQRQSFIGPMGGRLRKPTRPLPAASNAVTPAANIEANRSENVYPLVDLSEETPAAQATASIRNEEARGSHRRFVSDIDAVLDGPMEESTSDEEDDEGCQIKRVSGVKMVSPLARRSGSMALSISSESCPSTSVDDAATRALRGMWSHALSLRYGTVKAPAPGTMSAEQQVTITRVISPTAFYAQTMHQSEGLRRLELSMADEFYPQQMPIPAHLIAPDVCCAVYSDVWKTWRRGQLLRVHRSGSEPPTADVRLVDTGFERCFPADALKPINEHFTTYLPLVFFVKLAHQYFETITWQPNDVEAFRRMVENRTLMMKFVSDAVPSQEVELVDMLHSCAICNGRVKKCTINERLLRWIQENGGLACRI